MAPMQRCTRTIQVLLETWHNESGRLLDKTPSRLPPQEFPVLSAHANEGPKSISSPTHGLTGQKASADDQHKSNEGSQKNVGSNNGGKECCIRATPQQGCARMEDLTFPKNRKRRETTRVRSPNLRICAVDANDITLTYGPQVTSLVRTVLKLMPMKSLVRMGLKQYVSKDRRIVTRTYGPQTIRK